MDRQTCPTFDQALRQRLGRRYGAAVGTWFDTLPARLLTLTRDWDVELGRPIRRGSVSVVIMCRLSGDRPAVLKISPDLPRIAAEAAALKSWRTSHVPAVIAHDAEHGALLLEAIHPGTALDESGARPPAHDVAALVRALHDTVRPVAPVALLADRIDSLFRGGEANYARRPDLLDVVPRALYERGYRSASALAAQRSVGTVALHGDLTAPNVLDGGSERGLVAIDPAPCAGDPAFDTVDLLMWQVTGLDELVARADDLGARLKLSTERMLYWCAAFAPMEALEQAEARPPESALSGRVRMLLDLAQRN